MSRSRQVRWLVAVLAVLAVAGCAAPGNDLAAQGAGAAQLPGFWQGLWHGVIAPVTLIISWFTDTVGIYAVHNRGGWYDFGFMLGVSIVFGGSRGPGSARRRRRRGSGRRQVSENG